MRLYWPRMRCDREPARRAIVCFVLFWGVLASGRARAADIRVRASRDCADRAELGEQVDALLGRPVASVEGLDFDVEITERPERRWRLRLATVDRADGTKRWREIDGSGCSQLTDAAAVAIAMSIQSSAAAEPTTGGAPAAGPAEPVKVAAEPAVVEAPPVMQFPITVAALADAGSLPHVGWGLGLGAGMGRGRWLMAGQGAFLFSPEARATGSDGGGRFRLIVGGVLACLNRGLGPVAVLACAGAEAGVVQAEGIGINRPRSQNVVWGAGLLELGLVRRLNAALSLFVRAGAAVPWTRPTFTINHETLALYRPEVVSGRLTVGAMFDLF